MSAYVFRRRMHGDIDTMVECAKAEWRRPRIVEHERRAALMSNGRNRRDVLHLKRERCRRLGEYDARVGTKLAFDCSADERIVIGDFHAEPSQMVLAKASRRSIDDIGDEHVVARVGEPETRKRRSGQTRWYCKSGEPTLERCH